MVLGWKLHLQSFWLQGPGRGDTCSIATYGLVSSRGLTLTVQP